MTLISYLLTVELSLEKYFQHVQVHPFDKKLSFNNLLLMHQVFLFWINRCLRSRKLSYLTLLSPPPIMNRDSLVVLLSPVLSSLAPSVVVLPDFLASSEVSEVGGASGFIQSTPMRVASTSVPVSPIPISFSADGKSMLPSHSATNAPVSHSEPPAVSFRPQRSNVGVNRHNVASPYVFSATPNQKKCRADPGDLSGHKS